MPFGRTWSLTAKSSTLKKIENDRIVSEQLGSRLSFGELAWSGGPLKELYRGSVTDSPRAGAEELTEVTQEKRAEEASFRQRSRHSFDLPSCSRSIRMHQTVMLDLRRCGWKRENEPALLDPSPHPQSLTTLPCNLRADVRFRVEEHERTCDHPKEGAWWISIEHRS